MKSMKLSKVTLALFVIFMYLMVSACSDGSGHSSSQTQSLPDLNYQGKQVIVLNNNHASFTKKDLSLANGSWQSFSNLDALNRVGTANAMLSKSLMPSKEREPLYVDPTGWKNKKIEVNGKTEWLYNRSHLIGYQLTGENNNPKNLMTGTRSLNDPGMLVYENKIATYIRITNHHVRYQVEPIFRGNELVARGVHMQAKSIEDNQIDFNVYIFNVEPGVTINYADGSSRVGTTENNQTSSAQAKESTQPLNPGDGSVSTNELTVHDGGKATVTVKTKPNVQGTIEVDYGSGPSHASGLEPKTSDAKGKISWTWTVGSRTKAGTYNVIIKVNGETITKQLVVN
ncbi:DNA/RNA non-specific endonuclease [Pullulanibacillus sp. KACC 23026]|uniref:DNA/RNA non-specific endonuclease n=1 Tax=Pullulanibacillus sp. KACC 23026 TaxID=3028315 RepID=UPI0023B0C3E7|nr:DNA/RNA non-specific endonuclease [Pullulanibacillus sp. KACC 23026]WEG14688.1 DNA/RNA non-specific endonuclease [Pullulanibacillus sp. KACC 23026]